MRSRLSALCDGAQLNYCPNDPACTEGEPLPHPDWCGVCLLVHDVRALVRAKDPVGELAALLREAGIEPYMHGPCCATWHGGSCGMGCGPPKRKRSAGGVSL
jgi:hypothetical protein